MLFLALVNNGFPLNWLYDPLFTAPLSRKSARNKTLSEADFKKAWVVVKKLRCKNVYIFAIGQASLLRSIMVLQFYHPSIEITKSNKLLEIYQLNDIESERLLDKKEWVFE